MRIHKLLSENGIASRRGAEKLIAEGRVQVNGRKAVIGQDVDLRRDIIHIDGERVVILKKQPKYYLALNKPRGYVTTMDDELKRKCVKELISDFPVRVYPVGRLDKDSEGLLLLTNDGDFANYIMHPRNHVSKTYRVTVRPSVTEEQLIALSSGVTLDDGYVTAPANVMVDSKEEGRVVLRITITEGKNRQVRRMCEALGLEVARLKRVSVGPVKLGMLKSGEYRELNVSEVRALRNAVRTDNEETRRLKEQKDGKSLKSSKSKSGFVDKRGKRN